MNSIQRTNYVRRTLVFFFFVVVARVKIKGILNASGYRREIPGMHGTTGICAQVCTVAGTGAGTSIPIPDTPVSSVRHQYRYRTLLEVRSDIYTTSLPVPGVPVLYRTHPSKIVSTLIRNSSRDDLSMSTHNKPTANPIGVGQGQCR